MKYSRTLTKIQIVTAWQFWPTALIGEIPAWAFILLKAEPDGGFCIRCDDAAYTLEPGDWIVVDSKGVRQVFSEAQFIAEFQPFVTNPVPTTPPMYI